jgi:hypothetical protein
MQGRSHPASASKAPIATGWQRPGILLTNARLTFADQVGYFMANRFRILQACKKPGPYVYGVYQDRITKLWPKAA